jgi:hypothetical protein
MRVDADTIDPLHTQTRKFELTIFTFAHSLLYSLTIHADSPLDHSPTQGPSMLVAPVTSPGVRTWSVYLPTHASTTVVTTWSHVFTGKKYTGGMTVEVPAPLNEFPIFELLSK